MSTARGAGATQRERLIAGMLTAANRNGYAGASVGAVIAEAGVSRPTFYEHFRDRQACFLAAAEDVHARLVKEIERAIAQADGERALAASLEATFAFATAEPAAARFLANEPLAAGRAALAQRGRAIAAVEACVEAALARADRQATAPDISTAVVLGGVQRLLAPRLRSGEPNLPRVLAEVLDWLARYELPIAEHRWRGLEPGSTPAPTPYLIEAPLQAPAPLGPGRPRMSDGQVAENHRQRILYAVARLAETHGYGASTVSEITKLAGLDGRAFYALFADRQDAFMAVHEVGFQQVMAVTAGAFFAGAAWPERIWEAIRALSQFLESSPLVAHVGFVEAHAVGPRAVQRVEDSHTAFTIFLQEGYQHTRRADPPGRIALEATIAAVFELIHLQARADGPPRLAGLAGHMSFLLLAPFLGAREADEFIEGKLAQDGAGR